MNGIFGEIKQKISGESALVRFLVINIAVFVALKLVKLVFFFLNMEASFISIVRWLAVPSSLESLLLRPWTLISYMFLHLDFFHILFNMLVLYWSGRIFHEYMGNKKFISTYILGGLTGAILYIAAFNSFPVFENVRNVSFALGASASVLAILVATATYLPNFTVNLILIGPVKLKWIAVFFVAIDLLSIESGNPGGHIAHLGGAMYGYLFISNLKKGRNIAAWFDKTANYIATMFKPKSNLKVAYKRKTSDEEYNLKKTEKQKKIDEILDKISKSGYESLTKEEKETLFKMSKNL
jgi:membrane associated rhomboid family serine protease